MQEPPPGIKPPEMAPVEPPPAPFRVIRQADLAIVQLTTHAFNSAKVDVGVQESPDRTVPEKDGERKLGDNELKVDLTGDQADLPTFGKGIDSVLATRANLMAIPNAHLVPDAVSKALAEHISLVAGSAGTERKLRLTKAEIIGSLDRWTTFGDTDGMSPQEVSAATIADMAKTQQALKDIREGKI